MRPFALAALIGFVLARLGFHILGAEPAEVGDPLGMWLVDFVVWCGSYGIGFAVASRLWRTPAEGPAPRTATRSE